MTQKAMRIAFLIPSGVGTGYTGPGIFLKRLILGAAGDIHPVIYAGLRKGHDHDPEFMPHRWMEFQETNWLEQLKWAVASFYWIIKDSKHFDVVHFHGTFIYKLAGALACIMLRKPYVLVPLASNADISESGRLSGNRFIKPIRRMIVKRAYHSFALGQAVASELVNAGALKQRVTTIQNPVSPDFFENASDHRFENKHIVFIGVVGDRKRALLVLDAVSELVTRGIDVSCSFYGPFQDDHFQNRFEEKVSELGLEHRITHVQFSNCISDVLLDSASVYVLPSKQEGIPGALVESIAAGVPCVVTDAGSMAEIIEDADAGILAAPNVKSIADACEEFLLDRSNWDEHSVRLRSFAIERLSSESVAQSYVSVLRRLRK